MIRPYKSVKLSFLAKELKVDESEINSLLVELILNQTISGKIDQLTGFFEKTQSEKDILTEQKHLALFQWADTLVKINQTLAN